jgi:hypothetical protein
MFVLQLFLICSKFQQKSYLSTCFVIKYYRVSVILLRNDERNPCRKSYTV